MIRRCVFALMVMVLLALSSSGGVAPQVQAAHVECCPARGWTKDYYSDATYSHYIGTRTFGCDARTTTTGSTSAYYIYDWFECY